MAGVKMEPYRTLPAHYTQFQAPSQLAVFQALVDWLGEQPLPAPSILALTLDADAEGETLTVFWE